MISYHLNHLLIHPIKEITPQNSLMPSKNVLKFVTKGVLGIDPNERYQHQPKDLEKRAKKVIAHTYLEEEPTVREWVQDILPTRQGAAQYVHNLFPSAHWIVRYNLHWLFGDAIAGLTIGFVVVPQAMAYALLAGLTPEYGLYTSFVGAAVYWIFGTSKDIVIGTTAIGSLLVGQVVTKVSEQRPGVYKNEDVAKALSIVAGAVLLFLGLLRLGWIIEFIPYIPISAFVTAASITIMSTQLPVALGIKGINTREAPYKVIINTLKGLGRTKLDASIGLTSIAMLFLIQWVCTRMEVRQPARKRMWATISSLRLTFTILLFTFISWLVHRNIPHGHSKFRIVGVIESGFKHGGVPRLDKDLITLILPQLPAVVIILIIEHIAIAKSFGRIFSYTVIPSQEMLAQGTANLLGPFFGGYVCTGSFGASAVLSKAGVRTPLAGLFSAGILVLALYVLTAVFYYIPMAALAGLIIHAVVNLVTAPRALYKYWQLSPSELVIWVTGVVVALFTSLETSIYTTIGLSMALLLLRLARTPGRFLGRVPVYRVVSDSNRNPEQPVEESSDSGSEAEMASRHVFIPYDRNDGSNPDVAVESPYPGVFIYRFSEGFNYTNQAQHVDRLVAYIIENTSVRVDSQLKVTDRLWNDPGPKPGHADSLDTRPPLRAVVIDCSAINNIDITSVQGLVDLRNSLNRHAAPDVVEWHFSGLVNRWTRRALAVAGFGFPSTSTNSPEEPQNWSPVYTVASSLAGATEGDKRRATAFSAVLEARDEEKRSPPMRAEDISSEGEKDADSEEVSTCKTQKVVTETVARRGAPGSESRAPVYAVDRPHFHVDLVDAMDAVVREARRKDEERREVQSQEAVAETNES